jgi:formylglycine-generating enzyme required for sulfatase activity
MSLTDLLPVFVAVPSISFLIGTPESELSDLAQRYGGTRESYREESPQHTLSVPAFALARVPVTNALYAVYVAATGAHAPLSWHGSQPPDNLAAHPVVDVTWHEARKFCAWLTDTLQEPVQVVSEVGEHNLAKPQFRLPGEAEWEHAARGTDGRRFPWGDEFDSARANTRETGVNYTTSVGRYTAGASPYGVLDMAGNVWEWTNTLDALYPYHTQDGREQEDAEGRRIARGGCYANPQGFARCACRFRFVTTVRNQFLGFRLATPV